MQPELYMIDGVLWDKKSTPTPYCPKHRLEMDAITFDEGAPWDCKYNHLRCEECPKDYAIPRSIDEEKQYVRRKLVSRELKKIKILNLDDEAIPIAEDKAISQDRKFFVKAVLTESRVGQRLIVYAGERGKKEKTQIFVEPVIKRLAFDQKDTHPSDIFIKLEAVFEDGTVASIKKKKINIE